MIILTYEQANQVRGLTCPGHALAPVPLKDGTLALPEAVLDDPYHAKHREYLIASCQIVADESINNGIAMRPPEGSDLPIGPGAPAIGSDWEDDPDILAAHAYSSDWPPGETITVDPIVSPKK